MLRWLSLPLVAFSLALPRAGAAAQFSEEERAAVVSYWNVPGRLVATLPANAPQAGPRQIRLTPEGSLWLWKYQRAVTGADKPPPTADPAAVGASADWEAWVRARLERDRWEAQNSADAGNGLFGVLPRADGAAPPAPGPIPPALLRAVGDAPPFAAAVTPLLHVVTFHDGETLSYPDHVVTRPRYAYYRFPQGVVAYGTPVKELPAAELDPLFAAAGFSTMEQRVMKAVSHLEGGFDAVNTYDTGWVSVGFIQFTTGEDGTGSLLDVLASEKTAAGAAFDGDFRRFGIDVDQGTLVVLDPGSGAELRGRDAVQKVIDDARLTAVFQRAGLHSSPFRVAQLRVARSRYWPLDDPLTILVDGQPAQGKVSDVIHSEAGTAALFDRKVNRGSVAPMAQVVAQVMAAHGLKAVPEAAKYEREIVAQLKYRFDFLTDPTLSQP